MSKTRNCDECGKEYQYKLETSKYCSGSCRAKASQKSKGLGEVDTRTAPVAKRPELPKRLHYDIPTEISASAQFIIDQLKKDVDRWEKATNERESELKDKTKEVEKLRTELAEIKTDQRIAEQTAPGGLSGLMDSPGFQTLIEKIGPGLGVLSEKIANWMSAPTGNQIAGPPNANDPIAQFTQWLQSLDEENRILVWKLFQYLASLQPGDLAMTLGNMQNMGLLGNMWANETGT